MYYLMNIIYSFSEYNFENESVKQVIRHLQLCSGNLINTWVNIITVTMHEN